MTPAQDRRASRWWRAALCLAIVLGAWLRLDQFASQVLIDDEWHAVHQVTHRFPASMLLDFGFADYSIPLGVLYWYEAQWFGLSELAMRWPMMLCGLVTILVFPAFVWRRMSRSTAVVFAFLLATSPLLVIFSRMARPYAITLLLGWIAHAAFQRFCNAPNARWRPGLAYGVAATLTTWLHPIVAPFVLAPLLWGLLQLRQLAAAERLARLRSIALLALPTGAAIAALVLPPLLANAHSLTAKGGKDGPNPQTFVGVWYAWLGTPSTLVVVICLVLAAYGARRVWRAIPEARSGVLGILLTLAGILVTRPMFSFNPISTGRYLLPFVPLLLLAVAAGAARLGELVTVRPNGSRRGLAALALLLPCVAVTASSPLWPLLRRPNSEGLHFLYHFDFRPARNPYLPFMAAIPLSPYWSTLASNAPGTMRIAAAPFYFESYNWDAPRWERAGGQRVVPGYLTGLCVSERAGETPVSSAFRFRNAVHLAEAADLARRRIDLIAWQKPYVHVEDGRREEVGADTAHCEAALRARFGDPVFEDSMLAVFRVPASTSPSK